MPAPMMAREGVVAGPRGRITDGPTIGGDGADLANPLQRDQPLFRQSPANAGCARVLCGLCHGMRKNGGASPSLQNDSGLSQGLGRPGCRRMRVWQTGWRWMTASCPLGGRSPTSGLSRASEACRCRNAPAAPLHREEVAMIRSVFKPTPSLAAAGALLALLGP